MGFTRSTTDISVHQKLGDYPNQDNGLSAEELKKLYDSPAEILQIALNKLIEELEFLTCALNLGAEPFDDNDTSENNVQAKLIQLRKDIQNMALGDIVDGTITKAKLNTDYEKTLAKKDGELQEGLNSEMLAGKKIEDIAEYFVKTGEFTMSTNTQTINLGFTPRALIINSGATRFGNANLNLTAVLTKEKPTYIYSNAVGSTNTLFEIVENGFKVVGQEHMMDGSEYGTGYRYIASR